MIFGLDLNALVGTVGQSPPSDLARLIPEFQGFSPNTDALSYPPSDQERFRLFDAAAMSIRTAAAAGPLVPILEDQHEADRSSLLLLEFVTRQLYDIPLLVLATSREPEADHVSGSVRLVARCCCVSGRARSTAAGVVPPWSSPRRAAR